MSYANSNYYKAGTWNVHCDVCGFKFKSDKIRKRWDGLMVCQDDWEADHPQKFLRVKEDKQYVPFVREEPEENYIADFCDFWTSSALADFGVADCAYAGGNDSVERLIELYYPSTSSVAQIAIAGYSITGVI
jgi:hypothetical protein